MAPIGPCSLKHLPCYISFWISHGGSLKNRASEERKRGIDEDRWGRGAASIRQRCPFTHGRRRSTTCPSPYVLLLETEPSCSHSRMCWATAGFSHSRTLRLNRPLVCSVSAILRSLCNQPLTCHRTNICPMSLKPRWANGAGHQGDVTQTGQLMERAGPAGRGDQSIFYFTVQPIPLQMCASCLQSCESSRGGWPSWLTEPHASNWTSELRQRSM